jgi:hypothetical protein
VHGRISTSTFENEIPPIHFFYTGSILQNETKHEETGINDLTFRSFCAQSSQEKVLNPPYHFRFNKETQTFEPIYKDWQDLSDRELVA